MEKIDPNILAAKMFRVVFAGAVMFILAIILFVL